MEVLTQQSMFDINTMTDLVLSCDVIEEYERIGDYQAKVFLSNKDMREAEMSISFFVWSDLKEWDQEEMELMRGNLDYYKTVFVENICEELKDDFQFEITNN